MHLDLFNPWTPLDIVGMAVVGLVLGVALRFLRQTRDTAPLILCLYLFATVLAYTFTWRWAASMQLQRDYFQYGGGYIALAAVFSVGIYVGKYGASRIAHRWGSRRTGPRARAQLEDYKRLRQGNAADKETLRRLRHDADQTGKDDAL